MHEMALCEAMLDVIAEQQRLGGFVAVKRVIVEIGTLGHVDPHALEFAFEAGAKDTVAEHAVLEIREVPGSGWCMDCSATVRIERRGDPCPGCGGYQLIVQQGDEMRVKELEVV
jgi:hydrogenase nickel incorporation protein HypA/HybF